MEVVWGMFQHSSCAIIFLVVDYTAAFAAAASFVGEREKFLFRYNNPHPTKTSFNSIVEVQKRCKSDDRYLGSQENPDRFACPNRVNKKSCTTIWQKRIEQAFCSVIMIDFFKSFGRVSNFWAKIAYLWGKKAQIKKLAIQKSTEIWQKDNADCVNMTYNYSVVIPYTNKTKHKNLHT